MLESWLFCCELQPDLVFCTQFSLYNICLVSKGLNPLIEITGGLDSCMWTARISSAYDLSRRGTYRRGYCTKTCTLYVCYHKQTHPLQQLIKCLLQVETCERRNGTHFPSSLYQERFQFPRLFPILGERPKTKRFQQRSRSLSV